MIFLQLFHRNSELSYVHDVCGVYYYNLILDPWICLALRWRKWHSTLRRQSRLTS